MGVVEEKPQQGAAQAHAGVPLWMRRFYQVLQIKVYHTDEYRENDEGGVDSLKWLSGERWSHIGDWYSNR